MSSLSEKAGLNFGRSEGRKFSDKHLDIGGHYIEIDDMALKNKIRLKSAELAPNIQSVGIQSFAGCTSMNTVNFGKLYRIQREAFDGCSKLKEVYLPNTITSIGEAAFRDCKRLHTVCYQQSSKVTIIKKGTFQGCTSLQQIKLPWKLRRIETKGFYRCQALEELELPEYLEFVGQEAFYFNNLKKLELPGHLEVLGDSAFFKSMQLEYVFIPPSVEKIGKWVFHGSNRLKILEIHHDPKFVGEWITNKSTIIRCRRGSRMDQYCKQFDIKSEWI